MICLILTIGERLPVAVNNLETAGSMKNLNQSSLPSRVRRERGLIPFVFLLTSARTSVPGWGKIKNEFQ